MQCVGGRVRENVCFHCIDIYVFDVKFSLFCDLITISHFVYEFISLTMDTITYTTGNAFDQCGEMENTIH